MTQGITRVRPLAGGLDAWVEAGFPLEAEPLIPLSGTFTSVTD